MFFGNLERKINFFCCKKLESLNENQSSKDSNAEDNGSGDSNNGDLSTGGTKSSTTCVTPTNLLDEVPEFRPGQKWIWRDPKEVADDPNATPGSIKPSALTLNTNVSLSSQTSLTVGGNSFNLGGLQHQSSASSIFGSSSANNFSSRMNSFDFNKVCFFEASVVWVFSMLKSFLFCFF